MPIAKRIAVFVALWLAFEIVISLFATCGESTHQPRGDVSTKQYCTALSGPVLSISGAFLYWLGHILEGYGEAVIAVFTIVLAFATGLLWKATRDLVRGSEKTAERQLRAYISIFSGLMVYTETQTAGERGVGVRINVDLKNSGQTPAYKLTTWIAQPKILNKDATPWGENTLAGSRDSILGPGVTTHLIWTMPITEQERVDVNGGVKRIFVWGGADYVDAFGRKRTYKFKAANQPGSVITLGGYWNLNAEGEEGD